MAKKLVVDDSPAYIRYIRSILAGTKHDIFVAMYGEEAERMLRRSRSTWQSSTW